MLDFGGFGGIGWGNYFLSVFVFVYRMMFWGRDVRVLRKNKMLCSKVNKLGI